MINLFSSRLLDAHAYMPTQTSGFKATFGDAKILELTYTSPSSFLGKKLWFNPALFVKNVAYNPQGNAPTTGFFYDIVKVCTEQPMGFVGHISEKNYDSTIEVQTNTRLVIRFKFIPTCDTNDYIIGKTLNNANRLVKPLNSLFVPNFDNAFADSAYNESKQIGIYTYIDENNYLQSYIPIALTFLGAGAMTAVNISLERLGAAVANFSSDLPTKIKVSANNTSGLTARLWIINTNAVTNARDFKNDYESIALQTVPFLGSSGITYNFAVDVPAAKFSNSGLYTIIVVLYDIANNRVGSYYLTALKAITTGGLPKYPNIVGRMFLYANKTFQNYIKASVHNRIKTEVTISPQSGVNIETVTATVNGANENTNYFMGLAQLDFRIKEDWIGKVIDIDYKIIQTEEPKEIAFKQKIWVDGYDNTFGTILVKDTTNNVVDDFCFDCGELKIETTKIAAGNYTQMAWIDTATIIEDEASFAAPKLLSNDSEYISNVVPNFASGVGSFNVNACDGLDRIGIIAINDVQPAMPTDETPPVVSPPVVSWVDIPFVIDNDSQTFLPCNSTAANWQRTGNNRCVQSVNLGRTDSGAEAEEQDINSNSPTYNTTRWVFIGNDEILCPLETNPCNIPIWIDIQDINCLPVYRCKFPTPRAAGQAMKQKQQIQVNTNITSGSNAYGATRWIDVGNDIVFCPAESCNTPFYYPVCPLQIRCKYPEPRTSAMQEQLFTDYNPTSPTYLQNSWRDIGNNLMACPINQWACFPTQMLQFQHDVAGTSWPTCYLYDINNCSPSAYLYTVSARKAILGSSMTWTGSSNYVGLWLGTLMYFIQERSDVQANAGSFNGWVASANTAIAMYMHSPSYLNPYWIELNPNIYTGQIAAADTYVSADYELKVITGGYIQLSRNGIVMHVSASPIDYIGKEYIFGTSQDNSPYGCRSNFAFNNMGATAGWLYP